MADSAVMALPNRRRSLLILCAVVAVCVVCVIGVDRPLMIYIYEWRKLPENLWLMPWLNHISQAGKPEAWIGLFVMMLVWGLLRHREKIRYSLAVHALSAIVISTVLVRLGKLAASRTRPYDLLEQNLYAFYFSFEKEHNGFPSGHTSLIATVMFVVAHHYPRLRYACYALALAVAAVRVLQLKHYMSDVIMGLYVGAISAALAWWCIQRKHRTERTSML